MAKDSAASFLRLLSRILELITAIYIASDLRLAPFVRYSIALILCIDVAVSFLQLHTFPRMDKRSQAEVNFCFMLFLCSISMATSISSCDSSSLYYIMQVQLAAAIPITNLILAVQAYHASAHRVPNPEPENMVEVDSMAESMAKFEKQMQLWEARTGRKFKNKEAMRQKWKREVEMDKLNSGHTD